MKIKSNFPANFVQKVKKDLLRMREDVQEEAERVEEKDPFIKEYKDDGFRNVDSPAEEASDLSEHKDTRAVLVELKKTAKDINDALVKIRKKKYGLCEKCGKKIDIKRLIVHPTARYCIDCREKIEKKRGR